MKSNGLRKFFAVTMAAFILFWSSLPSVSMAFFIKPGEVIKDVSPITGVSPMTGGEFMIPGTVYDFGGPVTGGQPGNSGQVIIPLHPSANGQFILPNIIHAPKYNFLIIGSPMNPANVMTPGDVSKGNTNTGKPSTNGEANEGGNAAETGKQNGNGESIAGGDTSGGGKGTDGDSLSGEDPSTGGNAPNGKENNGGNTENGTVPLQDPPSGTTNDGKVPDGNSDSPGKTEGSSGTGSDGNTGTNEAVEQGTTVAGAFKAVFDYFNGLRIIPDLLDYSGKLLDGVLSQTAGFKIKNTKTASGKKSLYQVYGKATAVNGAGKLSTWLNLRYSEYLNSFEHSKEVVKGKGGSVAVEGKDGKKTTRNYALYEPRDGAKIKKKHLQNFISENLSFKTVFSKTGDHFKENWIPFKGGKINKSFFNATNFAKGSGIANIVLSVGGRIAENAADPSRTATDLAAGITTDVLIGAGQTVISAGAGWGASIAAATIAGSVVPGVGTIAGALVGIVMVGLLATPRGQRFVKKVESVVKSGIEKVMNSKFVKGLKGIFGG